ncbi:MAG: Gfo/Idh/MocA family oxidoreductase [Bacteroidetes bacterium]|nr:Gfo/Idh/MocA family oxidoreductase [Bacteroidota bacterium]
MKKIHFAVVGCGHIGKRHAALINVNPQAELTATIDIKEPSDLDIEKLNVPHYFSLTDFLSSNSNTDVVVIATPNGLHDTQAIECIKAGKHVVIEKPMALTTTGAQNIIDTATRYQKNVFVVMQNRFSAPVAWLKKIIDDNFTGEIFSVQLNCFWNRDERYYQPATNNWHGTKDLDGGVLFTQFSHFIDIFYWLFGNIKNIHAVLHSYKQLAAFDDSGVVTFSFGNNSIGCLNFSTAVWNKNFESSITIIAETGTIKIGGQYMDTVEYCDIKNYTMPALTTSTIQNDYGHYKGSAFNHHFIIQNVIDVLYNNASIAATAEEGLKVVSIIENIYKSAERMC